MTKKELIRCIDTVYYPVLLCDENRRILHRNRLARALFPELALLKGLLAKKKEGLLWEGSVSGHTYYISEKKWPEGFVTVCFFENFLPFYEPFSRRIMEQVHELFWQHASRLAEGRLPAKQNAALSARLVRMHMEEQNYLKLLQLKDYLTPESRSCSLSGFFHHLSVALEGQGIAVKCTCDDDACALAPPSSLSFLILSLVQFSYLMEGARGISVTVRRRRTRYQLTLSVATGEETLALLEELIHGTAVPSPKILSLIPLFCTLMICRKDGIPWQFFVKGENACFAFSLKASVSAPEAFLGRRDSLEVADLLNRVRESFSQNG